MLKIISVVVTYNRKELLLDNINSQKKQLLKPSKIFIVDNNSTDGTYEFLKKEHILDDGQCVYCNTGSNLGGAGGFEFGVRKAYDFDYDFLCLMDDDGRPLDDNTFLNIDKAFNRLRLDINKPIFLNSLVLCNDNDLSFGLTESIMTKIAAQDASKEGIIMNRVNPFNGTFINKALIDKIGYPLGKLFIRGDEAEYYKRSLKNGAYIATITDSLYFHPKLAEYKTKKVLFITFCNDYEAPWKEYYQFRNLQYVALQNGTSKVKIYLKYVKRVIGLHVFKIENKKTIKLFLKKAYRDASKGRLGKQIEPGATTIN